MQLDYCQLVNIGDIVKNVYSEGLLGAILKQSIVYISARVYRC